MVVWHVLRERIRTLFKKEKEKILLDACQSLLPKLKHNIEARDKNHFVEITLKKSRRNTYLTFFVA